MKLTTTASLFLKYFGHNSTDTKLFCSLYKGAGINENEELHLSSMAKLESVKLRLAPFITLSSLVVTIEDSRPFILWLSSRLLNCESGNQDFKFSKNQLIISSSRLSKDLENPWKPGSLKAMEAVKDLTLLWASISESVMPKKARMEMLLSALA